MKLLIAAFAVIIASSASAEIDPKLLDPGFLFTHAKDRQAQLASLQETINTAIYEVQAAFTDIIRDGSTKTLSLYQEFVDNVEAQHAPVRNRIAGLPESDCRNRAENVISDTTILGGYALETCIVQNDKNVTAILDGAHVKLGLSDAYQQVQTFVFKSFVGQNKFLDGEHIKELIDTWFNKIHENWSERAPVLDSVKASLREEIQGSNVRLGWCNQASYEFVIGEYDRAGTIINICENTPLGKSFAATPAWEEMYQEHLKAVQQFKLEREL